jgi:hypothetical protein
MAAAAKRGNIGVLRWAHANGAEWGTDTIAAAAAAGEYDTVVWLHNHDCPWDSLTILAADAGANVTNRHGLTLTAAACGRIARWALDHGRPAPDAWQLGPSAAESC